MIFEKLFISGVVLVKPEFREDSRGSFSRSFCAREFAEHGLATHFVQESVSYNAKKGTFRGMHFQKEPKAENKLVRCTRGSAVDVILDLRPESPTFKKHLLVDLNSENKHSVYIPHGCAHGFLTLQDETELFYCIDEYYEPSLAAGVRWNDPAFAIQMPNPIEVISPKDLDFAFHERR